MTGGVFPPLFIPPALLHKQERDRVKGVIINKFRGDVATLFRYRTTGIAYWRPVLGVMPWLDVIFEDEDGVALQKR